MTPGDDTTAILILDLSVRDNQFIRDHRTQSLAARLSEAGHGVVVAQGVVSGEQDLAALTRFVSQRRFDPVVLVHAWDRKLIASTRSGMQGTSTLVRLTDGVVAALDDDFDFVVDDDGLLALLGGAEPADGGAWKPTTAAQLRAHGPDPRVANPGTVVEWVSLGGDVDGGTGDSARATISGPSPGCPFLLDTRANPIYEDVELDPQRIQTRGCSFCLDNFGAYTVSSEADTVAAWMGQIRTIRAERPDTREFLLTDERPHPYLPAFFRALHDEADMAPVELLIKSRIDWLLEYADGELSEAARIAEKRGDVLHLYLVGFENFDQFHLDLFNKGVSVADNVAAIEKIRELGKRFSRSFQYQRLRAHGIVLFTPWTEPDHLIANAQVMREVGFDEFRADALDTRLRLYPRVPLHSKAEQEGLLVDAFSSGRPDRATEQGYDASVPWRFADARTEAVFQLARALGENAHSELLGDGDVLELAARFVLRWPKLADAIDLLYPAFVATVGDPASHRDADRMRRTIDAGAVYALIFDRELEGIEAGLKKVALKEGVLAGQAEQYACIYRAMGFSSAVASLQGAGLDNGDGAVDDSQSHAIVAVASDDACLAEALRLNMAIHDSRDGREQAIRRMGELLGYPTCCVAAFAADDDQSDNLALERRPFLRAPDKVLNPLNNRLAMNASLISHHLCTPDCAESALHAKALLERVESVSPSTAHWMRDRLAGDRLVLSYDADVELCGAWGDTGYEVQSAVAIGVGAQAALWSKTQSFTLDADGVALTLTGGSTTRIPTPNPLLVTPSRPMAAAALAAISQVSALAPAQDSMMTRPQSGGGSSGAHAAPASADALDLQAAARFLFACFGAADTPVQLDDGVIVVAVARSHSKPGFDIELTDAVGSRLRAYVIRSADGVPAYARTQSLSLAYYDPERDGNAPAPAQIERMMDAVCAGMTAGDDDALNALFDE